MNKTSTSLTGGVSDSTAGLGGGSTLTPVLDRRNTLSGPQRVGSDPEHGNLFTLTPTCQLVEIVPTTTGPPARRVVNTAVS